MNSEINPAGETLTTVGQIDIDSATLLRSFRNARGYDDLKPLLRHDGNFVLVYCRGEQVFVVNSLYSLNSYFYLERDGRFLHGETIHALRRQGRIDFSWNPEAIANLLALSHVIDNETLIQGVRSVPMGAILHWDGRRLTQSVYSFREFIDPHAGSGRDVAHRLIDLFLEGLRAGAGERPILTASSGLDSRVNLAGLLHLGIKPELAVMGQPGAKDVEIVKEMGKAFNLTVNHIVPEARDYIDGAVEVCRETNGVKPLNHWHTFVIAAKSGYGQADRVLTGNNGEHVRAVGFDYGILAHGLDLLSRVDSGLVTKPLLRKYWGMKTWRVFDQAELHDCIPAFAGYYGSARQNERFMSVMQPMSFVWQNDNFVLDQRRKGFQSAGLKLFRSRFPIYSPFLNKRWIDLGWSLPLSWRLHSYWHRYTVERLYPQLMAFPEEKDTGPLRLRPRPLQWAPVVKKIYRSPAVTPYVDYGKLLRRDDILALLYDHANQLDDFMSRKLVYRIIDEQRKTGGRDRLFSTLTSMAIWRASLPA